MRSSGPPTRDPLRFRVLTFLARIMGVGFILTGGYGLVTLEASRPDDRGIAAVMSVTFVILGVGLVVAKKVDETNSIQGWLRRMRK